MTKPKLDWNVLLDIVKLQQSKMSSDQINQWNEYSQNLMLTDANNFVSELFPKHYRNYAR